MLAVAERRLSQGERLDAASCEVDHIASRRVRAVVVEIYGERLAALVADDLEGDRGKNAAVRRAIRGVVRRRFRRRVRGDRERLRAVVRASQERSVGARRRRWNARGGGDIPMDARNTVDRKVSESDRLRPDIIGEGSDVLVEGPHLATVVVQPGLPADEVLDVANDEVRLVVMSRRS